MTPLEYKKYFSSEEFKEKYHYDKNDLGITYSKEKTIFLLFHSLSARFFYRNKSTSWQKWSIFIRLSCSYSSICSSAQVVWKGM